MPDHFDVPVPRYAADDPTPYRRSLRASQARRVAARIRLRRTTRGRRSLICAFLTLSLLAAGAAADSSAPPRSRTAAGSSVAAAQKALGVVADGVVGPVTRRAVRRFQRAHGLTVDGVIGPQTLAALGVGGGSTTATTKNRAATTAASTQSASALLEAIALCESGGDPTLVSGSGRYRGKYQFDRETWRSVGGKGDPAKASEAEQDRRAGRLMAQRGPSPWPVCAGKVGAG